MKSNVFTGKLKDGNKLVLLSLLFFGVAVHAMGQADEKDVSYGELPRQVLDYYKADSPNTPVILFVHGGGWVCCSKDDDDNVKVASVFHGAGYSVVSMDYTLAEDEEYEGYPHQLREVAMGIAWVRQNAKKINGNPDKIVLVGESAGGHLVGLIGAYHPKSLLKGSRYEKSQSLDVLAVVGWSGIYSLPSKGDIPEVYHKMIGGEAASENKKRISDSQPINHLDGSTTTKFAIMHGKKDEVVNYTNSEGFHEALLANGYCSELSLLPENGHDFIENASPDNAVFIPTLDFIERAVNGKVCQNRK